MIAAAREAFELVDQYGDPLTSANRRRQGIDEVANKTAVAAKQAAQRQPARLHARYDAAQDTDAFRNYWSNADSSDADSANSRSIRSRLVPRARYEIANNGYADGIAQTYATDLVGKGPTLRMQSNSTAFNQLVESEWQKWCKAVMFRRKLWCQAHAKHSDGEGIAVVRYNPGLKHRVKFDLCLYETEQCQTPSLEFALKNSDANAIDGLLFDNFGNPTFYHILPRHPGGGNFSSSTEEPEVIPAKFVLHWFLMRRPGQHRGVPECTSTLNTGAAARRWREATIMAAEAAANNAIVLKTQGIASGASDADEVAPMSTWDLQKGTATTLPMGWDMGQVDAKHPNATYETFHKSLINEQARPKSMPYNKAACDSSSYNYASGRLDHQTYYASLDVDREDCNDLVLEPLFSLWFAEAAAEFGWFGGVPVKEGVLPSHSWDWPKHRAADIESEANAADTRLKNGSLTLDKHYAEQGEDWEDHVVSGAAALGLTPDQYRRVIAFQLFPAGMAAEFAPEPSAVAPSSPEARLSNDSVRRVARLLKRGGTDVAS